MKSFTGQKAQFLWEMICKKRERIGNGAYQLKKKERQTYQTTEYVDLIFPDSNKMFKKL